MVDPSELEPVYLLTGSDRPKIEVALQRLRRHFLPEAVELTSALELPGGEVAAICNAGSLFGDSRLVVVEQVDGVRGNEGRLTKGWKVADVKAVEAYLLSPAPSTTLALVAEELKNDAALYKTCAKVGAVLDFSVAKKSLTSWVAQQFAARGARPEPAACAALIQLVGDDLQQLASEVDKLATWAGGEPIGEREVEALVPALAETSDYKLADVWSQGDQPALLRLSEEIFDRDSKPRRDVSARLAARFGGQVVAVAKAKRLKDAGVTAAAAQKPLGLRFDWQARRAYAQAEPFSQSELDDAVVRLAELDLALKGKSRLAPDLELQRALIDVGRD
ncbi:MAG: DNA polymerase III subunit delta [Actinobacteria bacterium]|nr:DNA polymerase III subunit delta [Actinomycetota bacterium]